MDTSKEYLLMCEKAQNYIEWEYPTIGLAHKKDGEHFRYGDNIYVVKENNLIPLYRQDQLQELDCSPIYTHLIKGVYFNCCESEGYWDSFASMEKFWLNYVMEQKHNKTWNGKEWS